MEYLNKGKEILKILINNGYEAYFIGAASRNVIMNLPINEVEINTSATPSAIKGIFEFTKVEELDLGTVKVTYYSEDYYISTFRMGAKGKTNDSIHYSKNLLEDLANRDYTINAIAMSHSMKMTDAYRGYDDIRRKKVRIIGKAKQVFTDSPVSLLRGIRFVSELNFKFTSKTYHGIKANRKLLTSLNHKFLILELGKILNGKYYRKALDLIISLKLYKIIPSLEKAFKYQYNHYRKLTVEEFLLVAFVLNQQIDESYLPMVSEPDKLRKIYDLVIKNPKSKFGPMDIYSYGKDICLTANRINVVLRKSRRHYKEINKIYEALPIKSFEDLAFTDADIYQLNIHLDPQIVDTITNQIIYKVLYSELANDYDVIKVYVINSLREKNIDIVENKVDYNYKEEDAPDEIDELSKRLAYSQVIDATTEKEIESGLKNQGDVIVDYTQHRIDMLERRLNEQERLFKEKNAQYALLERTTRQQKIKEDVDDLVEKNLEMLKEIDYISDPNRDKDGLSQRLHKVYMDYINGIEDKYTNKEVENEED